MKEEILKNKIMNKIYLVNYNVPLYDSFGTYAFCSTKEKAEEKKEELIGKIRNIKTLYYLRYDSDFEKDKEIINNFDNISDEEYDKLTEQVYLTEANHQELLYSDIEIKEEILL